MEYDNVPYHIALIPDGNRRWADAHHLPAFEGHRRGSEVSQMIVRRAWDIGIKIMSLWGFSTENWSRSDSEVHLLMTLFSDLLDKHLAEALERKTRILHIGRKDRFSKHLRDKISSVVEQTAHFSEHYLVVGLDYGGKDEIVRAVREISKSQLTGDALTAEIVERYLDTKDLPQSSPDLVIRTGGEQRTSGFMPWQTDYSEWLFVDKLFPDFTQEDLNGCIEDYQQRKRRFGK